MSISTIRSLEARGHIHRERRTVALHDERLHLTPDGYRALAAAFIRPRPTAPAAARLAATAARAAAR